MLSSVILSAVIKLIWDIYSAPVAPSDNVSLVGVAAFPGSQVSATPKLYSSKLQNVFVQIAKCMCVHIGSNVLFEILKCKLNFGWAVKEGAPPSFTFGGTHLGATEREAGI